MKTLYLFGNWKMNHGPTQARGYAEELAQRLQEAPQLTQETRFCLFPPFLSIFPALQGLGDSPVELGVQNVSSQPSGAFTGEVSVTMALEARCRYSIVGHSERRHLFGESSQLVGAKAKACCGSGLVPVICLGETLEERDRGQAREVVAAQLSAALQGLSPEDRFLIAYEPVWAIGTGRAASAQDAEELCRFIKDQLKRPVPVLYGGSVNGGNSAELFSQPSIDGGLIGGASLTVQGYLEILEAFRAKENA